MDEYTVSLEKLNNFVKDFIHNIPVSSTATVVCLEGDLGAGKTTFTQYCARELGVIDEITSPTFVIQKEYKTQHPVYTHMIHIDAYRLQNAAELEYLGWDNYIQDLHTIIFIEWPSQVSGIIFPENTYHISFKIDSGNSRIITQKKLT